MTEPRIYPMSALVGLDELVRALLLAAIDPTIGGVLLRGDKGSAKTTAARALASLLPDEAPFVEVPLGATEDRVVGSVDVAAILAEGEHRVRPGLLAAAHGGVLYVDEVNLLADHLVDVLLDAAATGVNRIERDGISWTHASKFVLVGSMNPEEGELRPQLLDRFGLSVAVTTPPDPELRAEAVRRRIAFDADPEAFVTRFSAVEAELAGRLGRTRPVPLAEGVDRAVSALCVAAGAEGLRADLVICRAAAALGGWLGKPRAGMDEVAAVAPLALSHRRRTPFGASTPDRDELEQLLDSVAGANDEGRSRPPADGGSAPDASSSGESPAGGEPTETDGGANGSTGTVPPPALETEPPVIPGLLDVGRGSERQAGRRRGPAGDGRAEGRLIGTVPPGPGRAGPLSAAATVVAATVRSSGARPLAVEEDDLRLARREQRGGRVLVLAIDVSGSMGVTERVAAARGAVLALVADAYQRRDKVAVVAYRGDGAEVLLRPTSSTEVALARLAEVATGGRTPLAAGIEAARSLALEERRRGLHPVLVVVTDGRATSAAEGDPLEAALRAAAGCRVARLESVVVDCERSARPLRAAESLAEAMAARYVAVGALGGTADGGRLARAIEGSIG